MSREMKIAPEENGGRPVSLSRWGYQGRDMKLTSQVLPLCQHLGFCASLEIQDTSQLLLCTSYWAALRRTVQGKQGEEQESWRLSTQFMESLGVGARENRGCKSDLEHWEERGGECDNLRSDRRKPGHWNRSSSNAEDALREKKKNTLIK